MEWLQCRVPLAFIHLGLQSGVRLPRLSEAERCWHCEPRSRWTATLTRPTRAAVAVLPLPLQSWSQDCPPK
jgi:hypothetical protein